MDALKSQIHQLEERVFFLENQAEHNSNYFKETLHCLTTRIFHLEAQASSQQKCDQTYVDGMITNLADIFQDNINELFSKMDDFEVQLKSFDLHDICAVHRAKGDSPEFISPPLANSACFPRYEEDEQLSPQCQRVTKPSLTSISIQTEIMENEKDYQDKTVILEDSLLCQSKALGKYLFPDPSDNIDKQTLKNIDNNIIPYVKKLCVNLQRSLIEYSKFDIASASIYKHITEALNAAEIWTASMNMLSSKSLLNSSAASTSTRSIKQVCNMQFPCIIKGHQHSVADCKEFYLQTPQKRVFNKKSFDFKYCTVCLQSNSTCRFRKCSNLKFIPQVLVCRECKLSSRTEGKGFYSVFYCLNKNHTKPSNSDILRALHYYVPGCTSSLSSALDSVAFKWHDFNNKKRQQRVVVNRKHSKDQPYIYSNSNLSHISSYDQSHSNTKDMEIDFNNHRYKIPQELNKGVSQFWNNLRNMENG